MNTAASFVVGYRYLTLLDWDGDGHTHALSIEGFPMSSRYRWLRFGMGLDMGFRVYEGHTDWATWAYASIGAQYPRRISPYLTFNAGGGVMYRKRFAQNITDGMWVLGFDGGATFRISRTFVADLSIGYRHLSHADLGYNAFTLRVALGW